MITAYNDLYNHLNIKNIRNYKNEYTKYKLK